MHDTDTNDSYNVDLATLSFLSLNALEKDIAKEKERRLKEDREDLLTQAHAMAEKHGIPIRELLPAVNKKGGNKKRSRKSGAPTETAAVQHNEGRE